MMMPVKNWIDIVSNHNYFNLIAPNLENEVALVDSLEGGAEGIHTSYDKLYKIKSIPKDFPGVPPAYIGASNSHSYIDEKDFLHAEEPAPAQIASSICFLWDKGPPRFHVGPRNVTHPLSQHREDGFPALIEIVGLRKHYYHGKLHRKGAHPALKCDYLFAHWYQHGKLKRSNGPSTIMIYDYKEFWTDNQFHGYKKSKHQCVWTLPGHRSNNEFDKKSSETIKFIENIKGNLNIFNNTCFDNPEDEFCYIAEFGS